MSKRNLFIAVLGSLSAAALAFPASAHQPEDAWVADSRTGCKLWGYAPQPDRTVTWSGSCPDGYASGRGVAVWSIDGKPLERYEGDMLGGTYQGKGLYVWDNGERYSGDWAKGLQQGHGTYVWPNGDRFEGDYARGLRQGHGTYLWSTGRRYEGDYAGGVRHGYGIDVWPDGNRYEGGFANDLVHGIGTARINGVIHSGIWVKGCFRQGNVRASWDVESAQCGF